MIDLTNLCHYLDELLKPSLFSDYCINGLQIEGTSKINKIATAVSANLQTIEVAAATGVQALIVHHGLLWNNDISHILGSKKEKLKILLTHGINLLAYHLPLDAHETLGNNWKAARDLGWKNLTPFGYYKGIPIGVMGTIPATSRDKFQKKIEEYYMHPATYALGGKQKIHKVALISGGAYKSICEAASAGADCFITGNFDEPVWHQAFEEKINFYALGHSATERIGPKALGDHLAKHFGIKHQFLDIPNPF